MDVCRVYGDSILLYSFNDLGIKGEMTTRRQVCKHIGAEWVSSCEKVESNKINNNDCSKFVT